MASRKSGPVNSSQRVDSLFCARAATANAPQANTAANVTAKPRAQFRCMSVRSRPPIFFEPARLYRAWVKNRTERPDVNDVKEVKEAKELEGEDANGADALAVCAEEFIW